MSDTMDWASLHVKSSKPHPYNSRKRKTSNEGTLICVSVIDMMPQLVSVCPILFVWRNRVLIAQDEMCQSNPHPLRILVPSECCYGLHAVCCERLCANHGGGYPGDTPRFSGSECSLQDSGYAVLV